MKNRLALPITFVSVSSLALALGAYLLATKTTFHPQLFITACGEVLKDIQEHVHFNPDGILSSLILLITAISVSLALFQLVKFIVSHRRLHKFQTQEALTDNLREIINKHNLSSDSVLIVKNTKLTAYTIGLFKPKIIVSKALAMKLSQDQLEAVVLHELYHLRSRHLFWLLLSKLVSSLFFFIPLVEYLAQQLKTEFELAADAFVVEKQKTRDHLCGSLALNIQYAGGVIPHFATSPIEKRVESLVGDRLSFELIGIKPLVVSTFSLALMLGMAFVQPNQVVANFAFESGGVCSLEEGCQNTDCSSHDTDNSNNFTPVVSASFPFSSSH
jgi:beta-lactamase regulating signal transducer with metallopeptidase domain